MKARFELRGFLALVASRGSYLRKVECHGCDAGCVSAQVLVLDQTPAAGYRAFLNFLANVSPQDIADTHAALQRAAERAHASAARPECANLSAAVPILAAIHHPLSTTQYPAGGTEAFPRLHELLAHHGVSLVVSGHLHDAFGPRLHGYHKLQRPADSSGASQTQRLPRLLEAEAADWKVIRRFRLITLAGDVASFTDLRFHVSRAPAPAQAASPAANNSSAAADAAPAPLDPVTGVRVVYEDATGVADPYIIHIVEPPDARYFPARTLQRQWELRRVHAMVIWASDVSARHDAQSHLQAPVAPSSVSAHLSCAERSGTVAWQRSVPLTAFPADDAGAGKSACPPQWPLHVAAQLSDEVVQLARACETAGNTLQLQVLADGGVHGLAASERRTTRAVVTPDAAPLPMGTTLVESFTLAARWPCVSLALYLSLLAAAVGTLVAARLARNWLTQTAFAVLGAHSLPCGAFREKQIMTAGTDAHLVF